MLKYLRIAVTALSLTACMLLVALWVRSYWNYDAIYQDNDSPQWDVSFGSSYGRLFYSAMDLPNPTTDGWELIWGGATTKKKQWFNWWLHEAFTSIYVPFWSVVPPLALVSALFAKPWLHWPKRFSIHALLIITALIAVLLGVIVLPDFRISLPTLGSNARL